MSNFNLWKIILLLVILSLYIFAFSFVGSIESEVPDAHIDEGLEFQNEADRTKRTKIIWQTEPTVWYSTSITATNEKKPRSADFHAVSAPAYYSGNSSQASTEEPPEFYQVSETTTATTTTAPSEKTHETTTTPKTSESSLITTTPATTLATSQEDLDEIEEIIVSDESEELEEAPPETTTAVTTSETEKTEDAETTLNLGNETFTVRTNSRTVTDSAANIVAKIAQNEIGSSFNKEAIKAQVVATYSYVKFNNMNDQIPDVNMATTASTRIIECVNEVLGEAVYYNGELAQTVYCSSSAGYTSSAKNVWGYDIPYLRSVECVHDLTDPNFGKTAIITSETVKSRVLSNTGIVLDGDPSQWIKILGYHDEVYVADISIGGQTSYNLGNGDIKLTGRVLREKIIGKTELRSSAFDINYNSATDSFTFTTYGYGHGVGLSQNGANALAAAGYTYKEILAFYFQGTVVK